MVSAVAGAVLLAIEVALRYGYEYPVKLFKIFHDILGELSFGAFISWSAENVSYLESFLDAHEKALLAFTYYADPIMLFNFGFETIANDEDILSWIGKYRYLDAAFSQISFLRKEGKLTSDVLKFMNTLVYISPMSWIIRIFEDVLTDPKKYYDEFCAAIYGFYTENEGNVQGFLDKTIKHFEEAPSPTIAVLLEPTLFDKINPILHYQWVTWLSQIKLHFAYKYALENLKFPKIPKEFWQKLHARLYLDDKKIAWQRLRGDGEAVFKIPKKVLEEKNPRRIVVDVMGLKSEWLRQPAQHFKIYVWDTGVWIDSSDPQYAVVSDLGGGWYEIRWEDMKGQPNPDWDFDDALVRYKIEDNTIRIQVLDGEHGYTNQVFYVDTSIYTLQPKGDPTIQLHYEATHDIYTGDLIWLYYKD